MAERKVEKDKLQETMERLEVGIKELFDSGRYQNYLNVMSRFHNYSFNNTILIAMQKPDASLIAGYNTWKNNFGRNVMRGEKGIRILAPAPYKIRQEVEKKDPQTGKTVIGGDGNPVMETKEIQIHAYKVVSVFDVSQTEGRELPSIANELTGDVEQYEEFFAALKMISPVPISFEKIEGTAHGYYHSREKRIAIDSGLSQFQSLKTAIHEISHAKLHDIDLNVPQEGQEDRPDRRTREVQAESIAYAVCQHYGLDTSDYSFGYVAGWSSGRELAELKASLETIRSTASDMIGGIDAYFVELAKQREAKESVQKQNKKENDFSQQIDDVLAGKADRYNDVRVCATPDLLIQAGCTQLPMFITKAHIRAIIHPKGKNPHWHGLTVQQLKKVPNLLSDPVMIFDSASRKDSIVVVLGETDNEKLPIIISVRPQGKGKYELSEVGSNFITSIYGKDNFRNFIEMAIQEDRMVYCSKQKSQELFSVLGLQLPQGFNNLDSDKIIHLSRNIVKDGIRERSSVIGKLQQAKEAAAGSDHGMDDKAKTRQHQQENSR